MSDRRALAWVRASAVATLVALSLMVWSFVDPQPLAMMVFMTAGQALGTLSLILYVAAVSWELIGRRMPSSAAPLVGVGSDPLVAPVDPLGAGVNGVSDDLVGAPGEGER